MFVRRIFLAAILLGFLGVFAGCDSASPIAPKEPAPVPKGKPTDVFSTPPAKKPVGK